jgi:hypothetical protein
VVEPAGDQLVTYLPIQLLMKRLLRAAIEPEHLECDDRTPSALPIQLRGRPILSARKWISRFLQSGLYRFGGRAVSIAR